MARNFRTFADGINVINGYEVNVIRFVSAQQVSATSRIAAHYWGTITTPDGEEIDMGESGMTVVQIKKIIGGETRTYNRNGDNGEIKKLEELKSTLESLGMSTTEVDAKIEAKKAEIEAERNRVDNSAEIKRINKEIKKLEKVKSQISALGLSTLEVDGKINELHAEIMSLM